MTSFPPAPPSLPGSECDRFGMAAALRVDRELGPAESAALEEHLAVCPACRARAQDAQAVTAILKRWESEKLATVRAPSRLALSVRTTLLRDGRWRRAEMRLVRTVKLATAASVLVALGAGLLLGLRFSAAPSVAPVDRPALVLGAHGPAVRPAPIRIEPFGRPLDLPDPAPSRLLTAATVAASSEDWLAGGEFPLAGDALARLETRRLRFLDFEQQTGEPGVLWTDALGSQRLVTVNALAYLRGRGAEDVEDFLARHVRAPGTGSVAGHSYAEPPVLTDTGRTVADFLPLPGDGPELRAWLHTAAPITLFHEGNGDGRRVHFIGSASPIPQTGGRGAGPWDLAEAVKAGFVTLREGVDSDLVIFVRDARRPILVPVGELIRGGRVDRAVEKSVWIPAAKGERRYELPCVPVGTSHADSDDAPMADPTPVGELVNPAIRGLLMRGVSPEELLTKASDLIPYVSSDGFGWRFSLLGTWWRAENLREVEHWTPKLEDALQDAHARGYMVTGADGELLDLAMTDLPPRAAHRLLARLLRSHVMEGAIRQRFQALEQDDPLANGDKTQAEVTLLNLIGYDEDTFQVLLEKGEAAWVARMVEPRTQVAFEVLVSSEGKKAILFTAAR